jgi:ribosomal protein S12 methylthiotransferase accessory factor
MKMETGWDLTRLPEAFRLLLADDEGPVGKLRLFAPSPDLPRLTYAAAVVTGEVARRLSGANQCYLAARQDPVEAVCAACAELVERVTFLDAENLDARLALADELPGEACPAGLHGIYTAEQYADEAFPWKPFRESGRYLWVRGRPLGEVGSIWLPFDLVRIYKAPSHNRLIKPTSNGCACHTSRAKAVANGLMECIERDSTLLTWRFRIPSLRIKTSGTDDEALAQYMSGGRVYEFLHCAVDVDLPVIICISRPSLDCGGATFVTSACRLSGREALLAALLEHAQLAVQYACAPMVPSFGEHVGGVSRASHAAFCAEHLRGDLLRDCFPLRGEISLNEYLSAYPGSDRPELDRLVEQVAGVSDALFVVDASHARLAHWRLHACRVIAPGLLPLFFDPGQAPLGHPRLDAKRRKYPGPLNELTHPFL